MNIDFRMLVLAVFTAGVSIRALGQVLQVRDMN